MIAQSCIRGALGSLYLDREGAEVAWEDLRDRGELIRAGLDHPLLSSPCRDMLGESLNIDK